MSDQNEFRLPDGDPPPPSKPPKEPMGEVKKVLTMLGICLLVLVVGVFVLVGLVVATCKLR